MPKSVIEDCGCVASKDDATLTGQQLGIQIPGLIGQHLPGVLHQVVIPGTVTGLHPPTQIISPPQTVFLGQQPLGVVTTGTFATGYVPQPGVPALPVTTAFTGVTIPGKPGQLTAGPKLPGPPTAPQGSALLPILPPLVKPSLTGPYPLTFTTAKSNKAESASPPRFSVPVAPSVEAASPVLKPGFARQPQQASTGEPGDFPRVTGPFPPLRSLPQPSQDRRTSNNLRKEGGEKGLPPSLGFDGIPVPLARIPPVSPKIYHTVSRPLHILKLPSVAAGPTPTPKKTLLFGAPFKPDGDSPPGSRPSLTDKPAPTSPGETFPDRFLKLKTPLGGLPEEGGKKPIFKTFPPCDEYPFYHLIRQALPPTHPLRAGEKPRTEGGGSPPRKVPALTLSLGGPKLPASLLAPGQFGGVIPVAPGKAFKQTLLGVPKSAFQSPDQQRAAPLGGPGGLPTPSSSAKLPPGARLPQLQGVLPANRNCSLKGV